MTRIRPPRKPKGEDSAVTIANQDNQIKLLIERMEEYRKEADRLQKISMELDELRQHSFKKEQANCRLLGWQDCAREVLQMLVEK
jgi:hypothetical protein